MLTARTTDTHGNCGRILFEVQDVRSNQRWSIDQNEKWTNAHGRFLFSNWVHWKNFKNRVMNQACSTDAV